jgi:hypothetical protein
LPLTGDVIVPLFGSNWKLYEYTASSEGRLLQLKMSNKDGEAVNSGG